MLSISRLISIGWQDDWSMMNWEGFGRKRSWPNWGTIPAFAWRETHKKILTLDGRCRDVIRTEHHLHTSSEPYRWTNLHSKMRMRRIMEGSTRRRWVRLKMLRESNAISVD
jgi:hypothetical protein